MKLRIVHVGAERGCSVVDSSAQSRRPEISSNIHQTCHHTYTVDATVPDALDPLLGRPWLGAEVEAKAELERTRRMVLVFSLPLPPPVPPGVTTGEAGVVPRLPESRFRNELMSSSPQERSSASFRLSAASSLGKALLVPREDRSLSICMSSMLSSRAASRTSLSLSCKRASAISLTFFDIRSWRY